MKVLSKGIMLGLSALMLTACPLSFTGDGFIGKSISRSDFITEALRLEDKAKAKADSVDTIRFNFEVVTESSTEKSSLVGHKVNGDWVCEDSTQSMKFYSQLLNWQISTAPVLASVMSTNSSSYANAEFKKTLSGYTIKDESQYLVFDNDGLLTKYVNETSEMKSTVEYAF